MTHLRGCPLFTHPSQRQNPADFYVCICYRLMLAEGEMGALVPDDPLTVDDEPWTAEPLPTWPRHDPATGFGLALIVGAVVVACLVAWRWRR